MTTSTLDPRTVPDAEEATWLRVAQISMAVLVPALVVLAVAGSLFTTISDGGDFRYPADYWYTAAGLPITAAGIGLVLAVHRLQRGADGRLGTIGVWINTLALVELFAQLLGSVLTSSELRWGPAYPVCALLSFTGVALLAAGSWRTGILPRWVLGAWPVLWIVGSIASFGPTPLLLAVFIVVLVVTLSRRVDSAHA